MYTPKRTKLQFKIIFDVGTPVPAGAPNRGGGVGGVSTLLNFGWGVEHLSTPPDFEKKNFRGGWLPLN